jgi:hypothetical protein
VYPVVGKQPLVLQACPKYPQRVQQAANPRWIVVETDLGGGIAFQQPRDLLVCPERPQPFQKCGHASWTVEVDLGGGIAFQQPRDLQPCDLLVCLGTPQRVQKCGHPSWIVEVDLGGGIAFQQPCAPGCLHGHKYVFRGLGGAPRRTSATRRPVAGVADVAKLAELSVATVSNVLNRPERVAEATRARVEAAMTRLGFVPDYEPVARKAADGAHWRRNGFATWIFKPAAEGCFPPKAPQPRRPVPVTAEPFPGLPIRGRGAQSRAEASWLPIAMGLTPHGLRHSHKSTMAELHTHEVLSHERMGHELGGIGGRYNHVTEAMQAELCEQLTQRWLAALDARAALSPRSPVRVLDELLAARQRQRKVGRNQDHPIEFPQKGETLLRARPRKRA